jgi:hypothetical protein
MLPGQISQIEGKKHRNELVNNPCVMLQNFKIYYIYINLPVESK